MALSDDDDRGEGPSTSQAAGFGPEDDPQLYGAERIDCLHTGLI